MCYTCIIKVACKACGYSRRFSFCPFCFSLLAIHGKHDARQVMDARQSMDTRQGMDTGQGIQSGFPAMVRFMFTPYKYYKDGNTNISTLYRRVITGNRLARHTSARDRRIRQATSRKTQGIKDRHANTGDSRRIAK